MKTYTLLGHIFELEHRAHLFLTHYIKRIDDYATEHTISSEIVEDLKYNIIEKLYASQTPISEQYVMTVASNLGEPEDIFGSGEEQTQQAPKNLMEEWFGTNKPMLRGVCYWISKSFGLPIMIVRLVMLGSLFIYGTGFWLYPILALFVPFQDKKSSSGSLGNIFFELLRIIIWGAIIVMIGSIILGSGVAFIFGISIPPIGNQSVLMSIPTHLYVLAGLSAIALITLFGAAVSALFKKYWLPKGFALASLLILVISFIAAGTFAYQKVMDYSITDYMNSEEFDRTITLDNITIEDQQIILNLDSTIYRQFSQRLRGWNINEEIQHIEIIPSSNEQIQITVYDNIADSSASPDQPWTTIESPLVQGNTINLTIPDILFTKKVPFIGAYRTIRIAIPQDKHIIINNNTNIALNNLAPRQRYDRTHDRQIACTDYKHFTFNTSNQRWECSNHQTQSQASAMPEPAMYSPEIAREQALLHRTEEEARTIVEQQGLKLRVTERNGIESITMYDDLPNHIDVELRNGRVIDVDSDMVTLLPATLEPPINSNNPTSHPQASAQQPSPTTQDSLPPTSTHITQQGPLHSIDYEDEIQRQYRGLTLQQAQDLASKTNTPIRVVEEDGIDLPITKDFAKGRINLEISNGKVIDLDVEGY